MTFLPLSRPRFPRSAQPPPEAPYRNRLLMPIFWGVTALALALTVVLAWPFAPTAKVGPWLGTALGALAWDALCVDPVFALVVSCLARCKRRHARIGGGRGRGGGGGAHAWNPSGVELVEVTWKPSGVELAEVPDREAVDVRQDEAACACAAMGEAVASSGGRLDDPDPLPATGQDARTPASASHVPAAERSARWLGSVIWHDGRPLFALEPTQPPLVPPAPSPSAPLTSHAAAAAIVVRYPASPTLVPPPAPLALPGSPPSQSQPASPAGVSPSRKLLLPASREVSPSSKRLFVRMPRPPPSLPALSRPAESDVAPRQLRRQGAEGEAFGLNKI